MHAGAYRGMSGLLLTAHDRFALRHRAVPGIVMQSGSRAYGERVVREDASVCGRLAVPVNEVAGTALGATVPATRLAGLIRHFQPTRMARSR